MTDTPQSLGERIAALRERRGWKQAQLAEKAGISVTFLSGVENDKRNVSSEVLLRIATALGTSMDYLMQGVAAAPVQEEPLLIPPALSAAAEAKGWSHGDTLLLLRAQVATTALARRTQVGELATKRLLTEEDWIGLHQALIGDG